MNMFGPDGLIFRLLGYIIDPLVNAWERAKRPPTNTDFGPFRGRRFLRGNPPPESADDDDDGNPQAYPAEYAIRDFPRGNRRRTKDKSLLDMAGMLAPPDGRHVEIEDMDPFKTRTPEQHAAIDAAAPAGQGPVVDTLLDDPGLGIAASIESMSTDEIKALVAQAETSGTTAQLREVAEFVASPAVQRVLSDEALADAQRVENSMRTRCDCAFNAGYIALCAYSSAVEADHPNETTALSGGAELGLSIQDRDLAARYARRYFHVESELSEEDLQLLLVWAERVRRAAWGNEVTKVAIKASKDGDVSGGASVTITLQRELAQELGLLGGETLDGLLEQVTDSNKHPEAKL
ncbi:hypothetical protein [Paucibacter soli]|uniref:hypothetical protein n=1 Tax=Paucibacter soli TaxID=3133433 RepID=UPI0030B407F4